MVLVQADHAAYRNFVAKKLAVMDSVVSCTTYFVLKKYKQNGRLFEQPETDERPNILL